MILPLCFALPTPPDGNNVNLDDERLQGDIPKGLQKVELDLDDALFLEFEEEEAIPEESEPISEEGAASFEDEKPDAHERRHGLPPWKQVSFLGVILLGVIIGTGLFFWFFTLPESSPKATEKSVATSQQLSSKRNQTSMMGGGGHGGGSAVSSARKTYSFQPFVIEYPNADRIHFLTLQFSIPGVPGSLSLELDSKSARIRDGVFHYLKKYEYLDLTDQNNEKKFKAELLAVINNNLATGKVTDIVIEGYVVK